MEETVFKVFVSIVAIVALCVIIALFLIIIKILFLFYPEIDLMGIRMMPMF